jgi:dTDP-4-dehydrorhamnose 3,5-epimerase
MIRGLEFSELNFGSDPRGVVREFFRRTRDEEQGRPVPTTGWAQINVTESVYGALRGLHGEATDKLVGVVSGHAFGAWLDARPDSPTFGSVVTETLIPGLQAYVPSGVLNGFQSLSTVSQYLYCFSSEWAAGMSAISVNPLDATLAIAWPIAIEPDDRAQISAKDAAAPTWDAVRLELLDR